MSLQAIKQALFDQSVGHVLKQGRPSGKLVNSEFGGQHFACLYRSDDGCGCGAAPFIIHYRPSMENKHWKQVIEAFPAAVAPDAVEHADFIAALQDAHDSAASSWSQSLPKFIDSYKMYVRVIARRYCLDETVCN